MTDTEFNEPLTRVGQQQGHPLGVPLRLDGKMEVGQIQFIQVFGMWKSWVGLFGRIELPCGACEDSVFGDAGGKCFSFVQDDILIGIFG